MRLCCDCVSVRCCSSAVAPSSLMTRPTCAVCVDPSTLSWMPRPRTMALAYSFQSPQTGELAGLSLVPEIHGREEAGVSGLRAVDGGGGGDQLAGVGSP